MYVCNVRTYDAHLWYVHVYGECMVHTRVLYMCVIYVHVVYASVWLVFVCGIRTYVCVAYVLYMLMCVSTRTGYRRTPCVLLYHSLSLPLEKSSLTDLQLGRRPASPTILLSPSSQL